MKRMASLLAVVALAAACQKPETAEQASARMQAESDSAKAAIEQHAANYARWMMGNQVDSMVSEHSDNATMMPPNMAPVTGHDAIRQALTGMMAQGVPSSVHFTVQSVSANGPLAVERGRYHMTMGAMADSGKYLVHWHRVNGEWKMVDEIWNSDVAAPPPAPARRRG